MASHGYHSPQQLQKLHHQLHPKRTANRLGTPIISTTMNTIQESHRRRVPFEYLMKLSPSNPRPQLSHAQDRDTTIILESGTIGVARRKEPTPTLWDSQTGPLTTWTLQS